MAVNLKSLLAKIKAKPGTDAKAPPVDTSEFRPLPLIGHLAVVLQYQVLGAAFVACMLIAVTGVFIENRTATLATSYLVISGQIRPLAQQIPKAASAALTGQASGFNELRDAQERFNVLIERLTDGGEYEGINLPPTSAATRPALNTLRNAWEAQTKDLKVVLSQEKGLAQLAYLAKQALTENLKLQMDSPRLGVEVAYRTETIMRKATQLGWIDRKSTRLNSSHIQKSRMPSSA